MARESTVDRPKRRAYSAELKAQVLEQCGRRGASVAGVALSHNLNPNMVHRWIREDRQRTLVAQVQASPQQFIPLQLQDARVIKAPPSQEGTKPEKAQHNPSIQIEVRRGTGTVLVIWPLDGVASCAAWLRDWLR